MQIIDYQKMQGEFLSMRPTGGARVILADPPHDFLHYSAKGQEKGPQRHYPTMTAKQIADMPVGMLAADNCALFIWMTWPNMVTWNDILTAWGFKYAGLAWEWIKYNSETNKYSFGGGYGTRKNLEPCLLATRGSPKLKRPILSSMLGDAVYPEGVHSVRDFIEAMPYDAIRAQRREHSRKPDEQYDRIETMFDGPYVELFSRCDRPGWLSWGNQTGLFNEEQEEGDTDVAAMSPVVGASQEELT